MMKNKKLKTLVGSLALVGAIAVGATLAYFTDSEDVTNVITMGNVDIDLEEPNYDPGDDDNTVENVKPGQSIVKDPTITVLEGSETAYVRAKLVINIDGVNAPELNEDEYNALVESMESELEDNIDINETNWVKSGDYYYCQFSLQAGESVKLFENVHIPEDWGNEIAEATITIDVTAEAIQAGNFEPVKNENKQIIGWGEVEVAPYTPATNSAE